MCSMPAWVGVCMCSCMSVLFTRPFVYSFFWVDTQEAKDSELSSGGGGSAVLTGLGVASCLHSCHLLCGL